MDGGGGEYFGTIESHDEQESTVALSAPIIPRDIDVTLVGQAVIVLQGQGMGQWRQVCGWAGPNATGVLSRTLLLDAPFDVPPSNMSLVSITPYKGRVIVAGNRWQNHSVVQIYGTSESSIVADNELVNMASTYQVHPGGLIVHGEHYASSEQPAHFTEVHGNILRNSSGLWVYGDGSTDFGGSTNYSFSFNAWTLLHNNTLTDSTAIRVGTCDWNRVRDPVCRSSATVLDGNTISGFDASTWVSREQAVDGHITMTAEGINIDDTCQGVLVHNNTGAVKTDDTSKRNLLVIIADDFRPAANHSFGMTEVSTPNIDELSKSGLTFLNAYSQFQWCSPSRNSESLGRSVF